jgi:hypothetical protein
MASRWRRADKDRTTGLDEPVPAPPPNENKAADRPVPPQGARNVVMVVFDSLRFDSAMAAGMPNMAKLGPIERRWSYASWTAPSHYNLMMGLLPHTSPSEVYASEYYKQDFLRYGERLGVDGIEFRSLLPSIWLPTYLRNQLGYRTHAMVSMPVLNEATPINRDFDGYALMARHNDLPAMLDGLTFEEERPSFHLLNIGETHYPYALPDEDPSEWPRISGVHGVFKRLDADATGPIDEASAQGFFDHEQLERLRARQVRAATFVDDCLEQLYDLVPPRTWLIVTADHGELFGEAGYFGHGPIAHEKVLEVPFVEGCLRE